MADDTPDFSVLDRELQEWPGFQLAESIDALLNDNPETGRSLNEVVPEVTLRIGAATDLVLSLRAMSGTWIPLTHLEGARQHLEGMRTALQAAIDTPETVASNAAALNESAGQVAWTAVLVGPSGPGPDAVKRLGTIRSAAKRAVDRILEDASRRIEEAAKSAADVEERFEAHRTALEEALRTAIDSMNAEAAESRVRMEGTLSSAAVDAQSKLDQLQKTGGELATRLDEAYNNAMRNFESQTSEVTQRRADLESRLEKLFSDWSGAVAAWQADHASKANETRAALEADKAWADGIKGDIQIAALAAGFDAKEKFHREQATKSLRATAGLAALGFITAVLAFSIWYRIKPGATPSEIARDIALRAVLTALPITAAAFAARVYRTHSHLATIYGERASAAKAFEGFAHRATDTTTTDQLLIALAQVVFAGRDTGHHSDESILPASALSGALGLIAKK